VHKTCPDRELRRITAGSRIRGSPSRYPRNLLQQKRGLVAQRCGALHDLVEVLYGKGPFLRQRGSRVRLAADRGLDPDLGVRPVVLPRPSDLAAGPLTAAWSSSDGARARAGSDLFVLRGARTHCGETTSVPLTHDRLRLPRWI
jgi:hypothetical protein